MSTIASLLVDVGARTESLSAGLARARGLTDGYARDVERTHQRIGTATRQAASAFEVMARTGNTAGEAMRTVAATGAELAFGFGPQGALVGALAIGGLAIVNYFQRVRREMEETRKKFLSELERMGEGGDLMGAARRQSQLNYGNQWALRKPGEENAEWIARSQGLAGVRARIEQLRAQINPQVADLIAQGRTLPGGLSFLSDQEKEFRTLLGTLGRMKREYADTEKVVGRLMAAESERAASLGRIASEEFGRKHANDATQELLKGLQERLALVKAIRAAEDIAGQKSDLAVVARLHDDVSAALGRIGASATAARTQLIGMRTELQRVIDAQLGAAPGVGGAAFSRRISPAIVPAPVALRTPTVNTAGVNAGAMHQFMGGLKAQFLAEFSGIGGALQGQLLAAFGPMAVAAQAIAVVLEPLQPLLDAILSPLTLVGQVLAAAITPTLKLLYPVIKLVAVAFSFVGEIIYRVTAGIQSAVGSLIIGLGKLLNKLPGSIGNPLISAGEALKDLAGMNYEAADQMKRAREVLQGTSWEDAVNGTQRLADATNAAADAMHNVPTWWRTALNVWRATDPIGGAAGTGLVSTGGPSIGGAVSDRVATPTSAGRGGGGVTIVLQGDVNVTEASDAREIVDGILAAARRASVATYGTSMRAYEFLGSPA